MPKSRLRTSSDEVLVYRAGKRRGDIVRRHNLSKRSSPERCDNEACRFHTEPLVWNNKPLKLILDHINGVNTDNRLSNLRLLCPNCDSQNTKTRGGANRGRVLKSSGGFATVELDGEKSYVMPIEPGRFILTGQNVGLIHSSEPELGKNQ
jgi:hypothetical protein